MPKEVSMDREDGFERGFVAGWKARGEHDYPTPVAIGGSAPQPQWIADVLAERDAVRRFNEQAQIDRYLADPERCMPSEAARMTNRRAEEALDVLRSQLPDVVAEEDAEMRKRCAQVDAGPQKFAAQEAEASSHGQDGQAFCKNCGFPAKTCVCVPQQVNQQSWQGSTEVQQGAVARLNQ